MREDWLRRKSLPRKRACAVLMCVIAGIAVKSGAEITSVSLNDGWRFRAVSSTEHPEAASWLPAVVPGVVQTDLRNNNVIPDPFFGDNEKRLQWIGNTDWEYVRHIEVTAAMLQHAHIDLVFEGLDTFAVVSLNGSPILSADNQFRSWRIDAKPHLHLGNNELRIVFHSPTELMTPLVAKLHYLIPGTGYETLDRAKGLYPISHYMRKAPYSYGWDWGPKFVTEGIWKPVRLEMWDAVRVQSFHVRQYSVNGDRAMLESVLTLDSDVTGPSILRVRVIAPDGRVLPAITLTEQLDFGQNVLRLPLRIDKPARWFPNGYGPQNLYRFTVTLQRGARTIATSMLQTGLRSVELRREPDAWGKSFYFIVNGIPIFAKGVNVVPLDSFPPQITDERRRAILTAARDAHMNMLRIWGGGYYESDSFYALCDELGLMVWQDFMFGGAMVPGDEAFQENVRVEAEEQVERLSDHPSMALWCGNNEVETAWNNWSGQKAFQKSVTPEQRERVWQDYVVMFRDILKSTVTQYGNGVPYWPSTPGANFDNVRPGEKDGDEHSWSVWSAGAPITDYRKVNGRFISEFGFQSMPSLATVRSFAGEDEDLNSPALANHERFIHGFDRMRSYIDREYGGARDFPSFIYLSQIMQAEAIKLGVEHWRSTRPETMGTLYWQLNDCWPVASWSSIDYYGRWKALQYYAVRFYAPVLIAAEPDGSKLHIHIVSDEQKEQQGTLTIQLLKFDGSTVQHNEQTIMVRPLASTPGLDVPFAELDPHNMFAVLTLRQGDSVVAANTVYFTESRALNLPQAHITYNVHAAKGGFTVDLRSPVLARAVMLSFGSLDAAAEDNFFDLLPNEARHIHVTSRASLQQIQAALKVSSLVDAMAGDGSKQ